MLDLIPALCSRLLTLEYKAIHSVIPGDMDSYEFEQHIGRIKELKFIIELLSANEIAGQINVLLDHE